MKVAEQVVQDLQDGLHSYKEDFSDAIPADAVNPG